VTYQRSQRGAHTAKLHAQRLAPISERRLAALRAEVEAEEKKYGGKGEAQVVFGSQLSDVLKKWEVEFVAKYPPDALWGKVMGPRDWLKEMTGLHVRRIYGLLEGEYRFVSLSQADLLLTVIERSDLLYDTIHVIPNPNWSPERWLAYMEERGC